MNDNTNSLVFVRQASGTRDSMAYGKVTTRHGIYLHRWSTGHQELIMLPEEARRFAEANRCTYRERPARTGPIAPD